MVEKRGDGSCRPILLQPPDGAVPRLVIARAQSENEPPLRKGGEIRDDDAPECAEADDADQEENAVLPKFQVEIDPFPPEKLAWARCAGKWKALSVGQERTIGNSRS